MAGEKSKNKSSKCERTRNLFLAGAVVKGWRHVCLKWRVLLFLWQLRRVVARHRRLHHPLVHGRVTTCFLVLARTLPGGWRQRTTVLLVLVVVVVVVVVWCVGGDVAETWPETGFVCL